MSEQKKTKKAWVADLEQKKVYVCIEKMTEKDMKDIDKYKLFGFEFIYLESLNEVAQQKKKIYTDENIKAFLEKENKADLIDYKNKIDNEKPFAAVQWFMSKYIYDKALKTFRLCTEKEIEKKEKAKEKRKEKK